MRLTVAGIENPRLYSQTYFGTKRLLDEYVDEGIASHQINLTLVERCLSYLNQVPSLSGEEKRLFFRHLGRNYGRTVLYHFNLPLTYIDRRCVFQVVHVWLTIILYGNFVSVLTVRGL